MTTPAKQFLFAFLVYAQNQWHKRFSPMCIRLWQDNKENQRHPKVVGFQLQISDQKCICWTENHVGTKTGHCTLEAGICFRNRANVIWILSIVIWIRNFQGSLERLDFGDGFRSIYLNYTINLSFDFCMQIFHRILKSSWINQPLT